MELRTTLTLFALIGGLGCTVASPEPGVSVSVSDAEDDGVFADSFTFYIEGMKRRNGVL